MPPGRGRSSEIRRLEDKRGDIYAMPISDANVPEALQGGTNELAPMQLPYAVSTSSSRHDMHQRANQLGFNKKRACRKARPGILPDRGPFAARLSKIFSETPTSGAVKLTDNRLALQQRFEKGFKRYRSMCELRAIVPAPPCSPQEKQAELLCDETLETVNDTAGTMIRNGPMHPECHAKIAVPRAISDLFHLEYSQAVKESGMSSLEFADECNRKGIQFWPYHDISGWASLFSSCELDFNPLGDVGRARPLMQHSWVSRDPPVGFAPLTRDLGAKNAKAVTKVRVAAKVAASKATPHVLRRAGLCLARLGTPTEASTVGSDSARTLQAPAVDESRARPSAASKVAANIAAPNVTTSPIHSAKNDQTPSQIAKRYRVDVRELVRVNLSRFPELKAGSKLYKGTQIIVPILTSASQATRDSSECTQAKVRCNSRASQPSLVQPVAQAHATRKLVLCLSHRTISSRMA